MKKLVGILIMVFLTNSLFAVDLVGLANDVYKKAKMNKTESQWKRYFRSARWQKKLGIDDLSVQERKALLAYLNARSADKDYSTVPQ